MARSMAGADLDGARCYVRRRPDGRYQLVLSYTDGGRRRQATKYLPASVDTELKAKRHVRPWFEELRARQAEDREREAAAEESEARRRRGSTVTVADFAARYIDERIAGARSVKGSTLRGYETEQRRLARWFGDTTMDGLDRDAVQAFANDMNRTLAPRTVRKTVSMLSRVCTYAVQHGVIPSNPCDGVALPRQNRIEKNSLTRADYARLSDELRGMGQTPVVVGAEIALHTGMREGEVCALRWRDVDMRAQTITVTHNIEVAEHGTRYGETKRLASNREIPFGRWLSGVLSARRAAAWADAMSAGVRARDFGGLFVIGDASGAYLEPDRLSRGWAQLSNALGLVGLAGRNVTFHDLRHTYATVAIASGADVMAVSSYLGHNDPNVTLRAYANADPAAKRRTADIMDGITE